VACAIFLLLAPLAEWEAVEKSKWQIRDYLENGPASNYGTYESLYVKDLWVARVYGILLNIKYMPKPQQKGCKAITL
jgi:hypothetical protein